VVHPDLDCLPAFEVGRELVCRAEVMNRVSGVILEYLDDLFEWSYEPEPLGG
jgi:hypothetical protein